MASVGEGRAALLAPAATPFDIAQAVGIPHLVSPPSRQEFAALIQSIIVSRGYREVCEIGGGRWPTIPVETVKRLGISYTVLDRCPFQLAAANDAYRKVHARIEDLSGKNRFDFMFSRMVFEHVRDGEAAYRRVHALLERGGACVNYHPTLFAAPFVLNRLLPERAAHALLAYFRHDRSSSKFPAYYSLCRATQAVEDRLRAVGFRHVAIVPLWGHAYYRAVPPLHALEERVAQLCRERDWRWWASYALTVALK